MDNTDLRSLPLTSTHWGTYRVESQDGKVVALHNFEHDSDPSPIGHSIVELLDDNNRILAPMIRRSWFEYGPGSNNHMRGKEPFIEVSWDYANKLVANELKRVCAEKGNEAIYGGSYGWASAGRFHHAPSQLHRFLNCIGGCVVQKNSYSLAAAEVVMPHIMGHFFKLLNGSTAWKSIIENTDLFIAFGGVPVHNSQINSGGVGCHTTRNNLIKAQKAGVEFVNISPLKSDLIDKLHADWITIRPSTDTALLLGLAHTLIVEDLYDKAFLDRYTVGFDQFHAYLTGTSDGIAKNAGWASKLCTVPSEIIVLLARKMAKSRTMISISWSLTRQDHGEQPYWAAVSLAAMLGQVGLPGGGIGFGYGAVNMVGDDYDIIPAHALDQKSNPIKRFIPVARISDMLLSPGEEYDYNGKKYRYPDIDLIYWAGGNPFHHHQDLNRMLRAWQKPSSIIINEWCWNAMAKHADIILPCTTFLERNDLAISRSPHIVFMKKAAEPPGQCRSDYEIFCGLARKLGVLEEFSENRNESQWLQMIFEETRVRSAKKGIVLPEYQELKEREWYAIPESASQSILLKAFRSDPENNSLITPSGKIEITSQTISEFGYEDCPGHPCWLEPCEWLGSTSTRYPLHLISNQPASKLHSQLDHGEHSRSMKKFGREPIRVHPDDAKTRGINDGDYVSVYNDRGSCYAVVIITNNIRKSVVQMSTGAWFDPLEPGTVGSPCKHGNPNVLTKDKGTSRLAQGPIAHSCLVDIERIKGSPPAVTAYNPPEIIRDYMLNREPR